MALTVKRINTHILFLVLAALVVSGCAYTKDRANDFADVFTFRAGVVYGLSARVQVTDYFGTGAGAGVGKKYGFIGRDFVARRERYFGIPLGSLMYLLKDDIKLPGCLAAALPWETLSIKGGRPTLKAGCEDNLERVLIPFHMEKRRHIFPADCRVEAGFTLGAIGFDVGLNPIELADFLTGFFGMDFAEDDGEYWNDLGRLVKLVEKGDALERAIAAGRLIEIKPAGAAEKMCGLLASEDEAIKLAAIEVLGGLGKTRAANALMETVKADFSDNVRAAALGALEQLKPPGLLPLVRETFKVCGPEDPLLAERCLRIFWEGGHEKTIPHLLDLVAEKKWSFHYFEDTLDLIGASETDKAGDALINLLVKARKNGTPQALAFFAAASRALGMLGVKRAAGKLAGALTDARFASYQGSIAVALGHLKAKAHLPLIEKRLNESAGTTQHTAFLLAHHLIEERRYRVEFLKAFKEATGKKTPAGKEYFLLLDSAIALMEHGETGLFKEVLDFLEHAQAKDFSQTSYKLHMRRMGTIIRHLKSHRHKFTWNAKLQQFEVPE
jgi:hypothetical protein